jgi:hypothetical protein
VTGTGQPVPDGQSPTPPPGRRPRHARAVAGLGAVIVLVAAATVAVDRAGRAPDRPAPGAPRAAAGSGTAHATGAASTTTVVASRRPRPVEASEHRGATPAVITLQWVGDMAMSTELGLPPGGVDAALAPLAETLRDADLTLGNLEGTLSTGGASKCAGSGTTSPAAGSCFAFRAPPSTAFALRRLGFDLVNQANNHAEDFGPDGHAQTLAALRRAGVAWTGDPGQITYLSTHHVRVAFLGFAPYADTSNLLDIPRAEAMVRTAARHAAIVVVIIHAGAEGADQLHTPRGTQYFLGEDRGDARLFAHSVMTAGASIVLGSGPHVIRGVQDDGGHLIAYSLGNFIGYHTLGGGGVLDDSGIIRVALSPVTGRVVSARWIPITLDAGLPRRADGNGDAPLVGELSRQDFPRTHFDIRPDGAFSLRSRRR